MDNRKLGIGGAPTRATSLPTDSKGRKEYPVASGFMDYFPDAIAAISRLSYLATQQHHPDKPMHWNRAVSNDEADTMIRHFLQRGTIDTDGQPHSAKMAWRALAILQKEIEEGQKPEPTPPAFECLCQKVDPLSPNHNVRCLKWNERKGATPPKYDLAIKGPTKTVCINDGPYCEDCDRLADRRHIAAGTYWCETCAALRYGVMLDNVTTLMGKL